ncbi:2343_t:CDS:2 [Dentiscutata erythropus]|uniref:2343_t:CDS:1 n=1 Tax=Dentiscutata erythropus TaxID=1348616 RepID=A0A9N9JAL7_9GLOM|nr:2343_t:CDS:2 [Dentiscutata erythropus]
MSTSILKTYYQRGATILTPGQIEEIRYLKNKQNGNHFFEELRKVQSISSVPPSENILQEKENNYPNVGSLKLLDESITSELSSSSRTPSFSESIEAGKAKKKKKLSKPKPIQSSDLPEILTEGSCQNSSLDISYDLIASIGKNHIEAEEAIRESEKCLAHNSSFSPLYSAKVL